MGAERLQRAGLPIRRRHRPRPDGQARRGVAQVRRRLPGDGGHGHARGDDGRGGRREAQGSAALRRDHFAETPAVVVACYGYGRGPAGDPKAVLNMFKALGPRQALRMARLAPRYLALAEASSIYPSVQNLLLAARAHGLGANITIWHLPYEQEVKGILGIPKGVNTYAIVPLGYPRGRFGPVRRRPPEAVIHRDRW